METCTLFNRSAFNGLQPAQVPPVALSIKQRFDWRWGAFNQMRQWFPIFPVDKWQGFNEEFNRTQGAFNGWNQRWNQVAGQQNANIVATYFEEGAKLLEPLEKFFKENMSVFPFSESEDLKQLKESVLKDIQSSVLAMKAETAQEFNKGIETLLQLKTELELTGNFSENITTQLKTSREKSRSFFGWFIASLVFLAVILLVPFFVPEVVKMSVYAQIGIRLSLVVPIGFVCQFLFSHYKFYKIAEIKYGHLNSFLGGGATNLAQLVQGNDQAKNAAYQKLSDMFLRIDDLMGAINFKGAPVDKSLKHAVALLAEVNGAIGQIKPN